MNKGLEDHIKIIFNKVWKWVILCFFLVSCFFLLWHDSPFHETDIFIPIDSGKIPDGLSITDPLLKGIEVRISCPESLVKTLSEIKSRYLLDLSDINEGVNNIPIRKDGIKLPSGISIINITPSFLTLKVEKELKKELPVIVSFSGKPATGFFTYAVTRPSSVMLKGPENILGPIEKIFTKPIDVNGLSESFKKEIALDLPECLDIISFSGIILAEVYIEEQIVAREFKNIPVKGKDSTYTFSITPPAIDIEIKGPVNLLEKFYQENGLEVCVDLKGLKPGVYVRRASIVLPVKTILVRVKPEIFTVKIK
ncbi:MAG: hypothetical protein K8R09_01615 [Desulfobacterales bacterium]|nr:hypothetical protein [Desulfobacterales bacterium]